MAIRGSTADGRQIDFGALLPFLIVTFGVAWGVLGLFVLLPDWMSETFGPLTGRHPLFYLAVYAPAIAAFTVITYTSGIQGLRRYLTRLLLWRCSPGWYGFVILGIPLLFLCGAALKGNLSDVASTHESFQGLLLALLLAASKGPVEEFGWRGLALPLLQRRFTPFGAGMILGLVWGFWHLPAFVLSGTPQSTWSFTPFFVGSIAISLIVTPLFNRSGGSILLPAIVHFQLNNPLWPDAQPYDIIFFVLAAAVVVWMNRRTMFASRGAVTEVVPKADADGHRP